MGRRKIPQHVDAPSLELSEAEMRDLLQRAGEAVIKHVASLSSQPVHGVKGGPKIAKSLKDTLPERGTPVERLLRTLFGKAIPQTLNTASPGYLAYVPGGGLFPAAIGDLIALATNRYTALWLCAPVMVQLEQNVLEWLCRLTGLPEGAGGLLTSGGSMANLIALVTARRDRLPPEFQKGVVYASDQVHHSVVKAALFGGILPERVRSLPTDAMFRLDIEALREAVDKDVRDGLSPFMIVASAGTTNTGAIDDLPQIAAFARERGLWLHVDGAYGGFFALTERGRRALAGLGEADSITLDPHKGLFLPYGTGCLLVRDPATLRRAHSVPASYMPPMQEEEDRVDYCEMGPELSREARGLRVWLPLRMFGVSAFRAALDEKLDLAARAREGLSRIPEIEIVSPPELSLFAFRYRPAGDTDEGNLERLNRTLLQLVNERQRVFLSGARTKGIFFARVCVLCFRTHEDRIDALIEDVAAALGDLRRREAARLPPSDRHSPT